MVTWKLATRISLVILILIFAAACSRDGETTVQTSTPTLDSTATPGGRPDVIPGANTGHAGGCHAAEAGHRPRGRLFGRRSQCPAFERS